MLIHRALFIYFCLPVDICVRRFRDVIDKIIFRSFNFSRWVRFRRTLTMCARVPLENRELPFQREQLICVLVRWTLCSPNSLLVTAWRDVSVSREPSARRELGQLSSGLLSDASFPRQNFFLSYAKWSMNCVGFRAAPTSKGQTRRKVIEWKIISRAKIAKNIF